MCLALDMITCFYIFFPKPDQHTYLRYGWNWLEFIVVIIPYLGLAFDLSKYPAVKTVVVIRVLQFLNAIPGIKNLTRGMVYSVLNWRDVVIITLFYLAMFALLGLQLYMGVLTRICIVNFDPVDMGDVINETTSDYADVNVMQWINQNGLIQLRHSKTGSGSNGSLTWDDWVKDKKTWYVNGEYSTHSDGYISCSNGSGAGTCPLGTTCIEVLFVIFKPHCSLVL